VAGVGFPKYQIKNHVPVPIVKVITGIMTRKAQNNLLKVKLWIN